MSGVSRQVRRFNERMNDYWPHQPWGSVTAFDWSRLQTKNDDPAYRKPFVRDFAKATQATGAEA